MSDASAPVEIPWMLIFRLVSKVEIADKDQKKVHDAALLRGALDAWIHGRLLRQSPMIGMSGESLPILGDDPVWFAAWGASKLGLEETKETLLEMANVIGRVLQQEVLELHIAGQPPMKLERKPEPPPSGIRYH